MPYCWNGCSITEMRGDLQHWAEKGVLVAYISEKGRCICTGRFAMVSPDFFQRFTLSLTLRKKKKRRTTDMRKVTLTLTSDLKTQPLKINTSSLPEKKIFEFEMPPPPRKFNVMAYLRWFEMANNYLSFPMWTWTMSENTLIKLDAPENHGKGNHWQKTPLPSLIVVNAGERAVPRRIAVDYCSQLVPSL